MPINFFIRVSPVHRPFALKRCRLAGFLLIQVIDSIAGKPAGPAIQCEVKDFFSDFYE
jgi:hypothetical protein